MIKEIEKYYKAIVDNGGLYAEDTYRHHIMDVLLSGPNESSNTLFNEIKTTIDSCYGFNMKITAGRLMQVSKKMYTNSKTLDEWNKVDPKDAKILALATDIKNLKNAN